MAAVASAAQDRGVVLDPTAGAPGDDETILADLVEQALDQRERGETLDLHALCTAHPHLEGAVAEALGLAPGVAGLHAQARARDPLDGRVLGGRYRLRTKLGAGAMGAVYEAHDQELDRRIAVKVLHASGLLAPERQARFRREARALAAITSEYVVPVYDRGVDDALGMPFLVMARLHGVPLGEVIRAAQGQMPQGPDAATFARVDWLPVTGGEASYLRQVVRWGEQLARGLAAAHAVGVHHRDVKPSNVFVTTDGRAVLVDFGIASAVDDGALTASGTSLGTPWYMAPEQAAGAPDQDGVGIDVYGLGATLYHALALAPPFQDEPARVLQRLQREDPPRLTRLHPRLHRDLVAIVECAMARQRRHRYASAEAFADDLAAFLDNRTVTARTVSPAVRLVRRAARRPALTAAVGLAAVVGVLAPWFAWDALAARSAERARQRDDLLRHLPAAVGLEGTLPRDALPPDLVETRRVLDAILALDPTCLPALARRAAVSLDAGEPDAAERDLEMLATVTGSACVRELARRQLSHGRPEASGNDLPAPESADAATIAAFFALRERSGEAVLRADALLADLPPAHVAGREVRLLARLALGSLLGGRPDRLAMHQAVYDESLELEWAQGRASTTILHARGGALVGLERYEVALPILERALQLSAVQAGVLANLGICLRRVGRLPEARSALERALALRPGLGNARQTLSQVLMDIGDFDGALALVEAAGGGADDWRRIQQRANVHLQRALAAHRHGQRDEAVRAATAAVDAYREALTAGASPSRVTGQASLAENLILRDDLGVLDGLLDALRADPLNGALLQNLAGTMPLALDADRTRAVRELLLRLVVALSPDDANAKAALDAELAARK